MKIYFEGIYDEPVIKIGKTSRSTSIRREERTGGYWARRANAQELLLAAVESDANAETHLKNHFAHLLIPGDTEYFRADPELTEYIYWLRDQYFTWLCDTEGPPDVVGYEAFAPNPRRRIRLPEHDPAVMVNEFDCREPMPCTTDLRGTLWAPMSIIKPVYNDYYTPPWMINLAREGMGGIDLDAASHWTAQRVHKIPEYFDRQRDAHRQRWHGRVWLNAPYGDNKPWINDVVKWWDSGDINQLCWLAPAWAFTKKQAKPVLERSSLAIILTVPTDEMFWGWGKKTAKRAEMFCDPDNPRLGTNQAHMIVYLGDRAKHLAVAFESAEKGKAAWLNPPADW